MDNSKGLLSKDSIEVEADKSIPKIAVMAIIGIIFSFGFGYFLKLFFLQGELNYLIFCFSAALGFLAFFILGVFFIKTFWVANLVNLLDVAAFSAPFYDRFSQIFAAGIFVVFLLIVWGSSAGRHELENMLRIKFWRVNRKAFSKAVVALALFIAVVYAVNANLEIEKKEFFISEAAIGKIMSLASATGIIQKFVPGFDVSLTVDKLARNLVVSQAGQNTQFSLLSEAAQNQLVSQSVADLEKQISDFSGSPLNPQDTVSAAVYKIIVNKFSGLPDNIKVIVPIGIAILIFLVIVALMVPIRLVSGIITLLIYEIFLALGFSTIMMEGRSREIIVLK